MIVLGLLLNQPHTYAQELRRIHYGTTASPSHLPIWVAKDAGLFEKAGLNVEPVQIRGGSLSTLAIITGNLPVLRRRRRIGGRRPRRRRRYRLARLPG